MRLKKLKAINTKLVNAERENEEKTERTKISLFIFVTMFIKKGLFLSFHVRVTAMCVV